MPKTPSITSKLQDAIIPADMLPHEFLWRIGRGEPITLRITKKKYYNFGPRAGDFKETIVEEMEYYPTFDERLEAAKIAAPYYAPKLATTTLKQDQTVVEFADDFSGGKNA